MRLIARFVWVLHGGIIAFDVDLMETKQGEEMEIQVKVFILTGGAFGP